MEFDEAGARPLLPPGGSPSGPHNLDGPPSRLETLPAELLQHVLSFLAPIDLVRCRKVSRHLRHAVAVAAERDHRFAFACGAADYRGIHVPDW